MIEKCHNLYYITVTCMHVSTKIMSRLTYWCSLQGSPALKVLANFCCVSIEVPTNLLVEVFVAFVNVADITLLEVHFFASPLRLLFNPSFQFLCNVPGSFPFLGFIDGAIHQCQPRVTRTINFSDNPTTSRVTETFQISAIVSVLSFRIVEVINSEFPCFTLFALFVSFLLLMFVKSGGRLKRQM